MVKMLKAILVISTLLSSCALAWPEQDHLGLKKVAKIQEKADLADYKLPGQVVPSHYELYLDTNLFPDFNYTGRVQINTKAIEDTNSIVLHSDGLIIESISVNLGDSDVYVSHSLNETNHFLSIQLSQVVSADSDLTIVILFFGTVRDGDIGYYRAKYIDSSGNDVWIGTTQFEATYARMAFPCFDEPEYKATFHMTFVRDANLNVVTNTPLESSQEQGTKVADTFAVTTKMSTYLIAFLISDYEYVASPDRKHEVYARPEQIQLGNGEYSLGISPTMMEAMESYTLIENYFNQKMSQIGIPDDYYYFGAMENWGAVTYRETLLLFEEGVSSETDRQRVTTIVAHEYAHQWFGDLVSPKWWRYIWLNEGFATYFQYIAANIVRPEFRLEEQIVTASNQYAMSMDILESRPMTFDAATREEIEQIFDPIAYQKSGAVIRMMEHFLTTPIFLKGLQTYLTDMSFSAATEEDLFRNIQTVLDDAGIVFHKSFSDIMMTWTHQSGYPVIDVSRSTDGQITLTQKKFQPSQEGDPTLWDIPVTFITSDDDPSGFTDTTTDVWLTEKETTLDLVLDDGKWIILNKLAVGYYRVNYDEALWAAIISLLKSSNFEIIPPVNRAQIIDDAYKLASTGDMPMDLLMSLLEYIEQETDIIPLYSYLQNGGTFLLKISGIQNFEAYKKTISDKFNRILNKLESVNTEENEDPLKLMTRNMVSYWLCYLKDETCLKQMEETLLSGEKVQPDLQEAVFCGGLRSGRRDAFKKLLEGYSDKNIKFPLKSRIVKALGCTSNQEILQEIFNGTIVFDNDRDREIVLSTIYESYEGLDATVNFLYNNYKKMGEGQISSIFSKITPNVFRLDHINLIKEVLAVFGNDFGSVKEGVEKQLNENRNWTEKKARLVEAWLFENNAN